MDPKLVRHSGVNPVEMAEGISRRTLAWGQATMLIETSLDEQANLALHAHPHEQLTYLISGSLELTIGSETFVLGPGDSVLVPGGVPHSGVARASSVAIDAFAPPREEFK